MADEEIGLLLGRRVEELRRLAGRTQAQLAKLISAPTAIISRLERGLAIPSVGRLVKIARALDTNLPDLFAYDDSDPDADQARRQRALRAIGYRLRRRQFADVEAVLEMIKLVFAIRRRGERTAETRQKPKKRR